MNTNVYQFSMDDYDENGDIARQVSMSFILDESVTHGELCERFLDFLKASGYVFAPDAFLEVQQTHD